MRAQNKCKNRTIIIDGERTQIVFTKHVSSLLFCAHLQKKHPDLASLQAQSTGEDSNSSDHSVASDHGDDSTLDGLNGDQRHSFPSAFLGLQGIPGLLPGPSGMHGDSFGTYSFILSIILFVCSTLINYTH